ncbi:MAG: zf-HC2 domain-containing protein [Vicinamibacterales bacterium]
MSDAAIDGLYARSEAPRWAVTRETFAAAVRASVAGQLGASGGDADAADRLAARLHAADLALALACADGHSDAWDHFVLTYRPELYRAARAMTNADTGRELADSLYADLFGLNERDGARRSLFRYYHGRAKLSTWLRSVLAQRHVDLIRAGRRTTSLDAGTGQPAEEQLAAAPAVAPDVLASMQIAARAVAAALEVLAWDDRRRLAWYCSMRTEAAGHRARPRRKRGDGVAEARAGPAGAARGDRDGPGRARPEGGRRRGLGGGGAPGLGCGPRRRARGAAAARDRAAIVHRTEDAVTLPKDHLPHDAEAQRRQQADPLVAAVIRTADDAGLTCPDAEVLGLYAERELGGEEQAAVSAHVGGCARCQATLQAIERAMPAAAGAAGAAEVGGAALPARWFGGWRWLVPVTSLAAAAVVAVWLGQGRAPESTVSRATDTLSDALPRAVGAPAAEAELAREAPADAPAGPAARQSPEAPPPSPPAGVAASGGARLAPVEPPSSPASGSTAPDASDLRYRATARERVDRPAALDAAERRQVVGGLTAADSTAASAADSTLASTAPPAAPSAAPQAADSAAARTATPAAAPPARTAALAEAAAPPANEQPASKETVPRAANGTGGQAKTEEAPATPAWRVREGILERTRDEGQTWQRVSLPTTERIARVVEQPRGTVTVVTVAGTRLVSTDSGATWRRP